MAKKAKREEPSEIMDLRDQVSSLQGEIDDLQDKLEAARNKKEDDGPIKFLRDQLETLATDFDPSMVTRAQFERLIKGILRGDDWRYRTWL